ncbi:DUF6916 family protein [Mameliella sp.]|uniref:DUF6916 family protein n=1 Tax=Mameliella sp. TaxID=1924940 RepID=UPI003BACC2FE
MDIATLSPESFEPLIGEPITVTTSEGPLPLRITRVQSTGDAPEEGMRAPFTLTLVGPLSPILEQGTWPMSLPGLGETALFLSPFAQVEDETRYQISFS